MTLRVTLRASQPTIIRVMKMATLLGIPTLVGCGYMWVKKSDWEAKPKILIDSAEIVSLRQQMVMLQAKYRADSTRLANVPPPPPKMIGVPDSVLRARDAEIAQLKDQLTKAQDELERIKRRLASPRS